MGMRIAVACALVAGCSTTPAPFELVIAAQPDTVAFKPVGGDWSTVDQITRSDRSATYGIPPQDGTIAVACTQPSGVVQVEELFATAADYQLELYSYLVPWPQLNCTPPDAGPLVEILGAVDEGATVWVGSDSFGGAGEWTYQEHVTEGVRDVVVASQTTVLIRRDQILLAPVDEGPISLEGDGLSIGAFELVDTVVTDDYDDCFAGACYTQLVTANGTTATIDAGNGVMFYFPSEILETDDRQALVLHGGGPGVGYAEDGYIDPNQATSPGLGPPIGLDVPTGQTFGSDDVSVDFEGVSLNAAIADYRVQYTTQAVSLAATATEGWRQAYGGGHVAFDASFPDFRWPIVGDAVRTFTIADRGSAGIVLEATAYGP